MFPFVLKCLINVPKRCVDNFFWAAFRSKRQNRFTRFQTREILHAFQNIFAQCSVLNKWYWWQSTKQKWNEESYFTIYIFYMLNILCVSVRSVFDRIFLPVLGFCLCRISHAYSLIRFRFTGQHAIVCIVAYWSCIEHIPLHMNISMPSETRHFFTYKQMHGH